MKMALDDTLGVNAVRSYEPGCVTVRDRRITSSAIVLPDHLLTDWPPATIDDIQAGHFATVLERGIEVLILGTGESQAFPNPALFADLMARGIGFEVMNNAAACRTYNILLAEQRRVALAVLLGRQDHY
jgi:uncharacterized protein